MFYIQASKPRFIRFTEGEECNDLSEAIEEIFPMFTEHAFLVWNGVWVPLEYKYDLSVLIEDILRFLGSIVSKQTGDIKACFGSDTFRANWFMHWEESTITIQSKWASISGKAALLEILNENSLIEMDKKQFLFEWKAILLTIKQAVIGSGIRIVNDKDLTSLITLENNISDFGCLYNPDFSL